MNPRQLLVLTVILICAISQSAQAQKKFEWGINIGSSFTVLRGNDFAQNVNYDLGVLLGVHTDVMIVPGMSLGTALNYERRTIRRTGTFFTSNGRPIEDYVDRDKYHYINLPVVLKIPFGQKELWFLDIGGFANFLVDQSVRREELNASFTTLDYGIVSGVGKSFPLNNGKKLTLELRSELGLANTSAEEIEELGFDTARTSTLKLILTWVFSK